MVLGVVILQRSFHWVLRRVIPLGQGRSQLLLIGLVYVFVYSQVSILPVPWDFPIQVKHICVLVSPDVCIIHSSFVLSHHIAQFLVQIRFLLLTS
mmetsp:Transcript_38370/g.36730  ORF Transcript_38370/g.36730 Transcript_38370/m.36730 type:complete len:95 (-) Transcript_38370:203-487(-)